MKSMKKPVARSLQLVAIQTRDAVMRWLPATGSKLQAQRGFTLLMAALVASIVLMLGSSIFTIAQKQVTLSSIGRDSQFAFYAADTAAECALYYDIRVQAFGTAQDPVVASIICDKAADGTDLTTTTTVEDGGTAATSTFTLDLFTRNVLEGEPATSINCVQVTVAKNPTSPHTVVHSDGYSTSCATITTSPRSLQRSIELRY